MIAVIADDFTGAAELAGIGLRFNLKVEMTTNVPAETNSELLVIATDSRSGSEEAAVRVMAQTTRQLVRLRPSLIYKKIDSALRGHILKEVTAQLEVLQLPKAVIVPANPGLGRTLVDGIYYIRGQPIHLSSFSRDPEFAITSSKVLEILGASRTGSVSLLQTGKTIPAAGIMLAEVYDSADLSHWAAHMGQDTFLVGASEFFSTVLQKRFPKAKTSDSAFVSPRGPALYVCGSAFHQSLIRVQLLKQQGGPVSYMPEEIFFAEKVIASQYAPWVEEVVSLLTSSGKAIVAVDPAFKPNEAFSPVTLTKKLSLIVKLVLSGLAVQELILEGGATAFSVLERLGLTSFHPLQELAPGVIRMQAAGRKKPIITLKPGSYDWPAGIWP